MPREIALDGCVPDSFIMNLKALGVFRLLAEQGPDPDVRACWKDGRFCLSTDSSDDELVGFFLREYKPTPLVSPWNGGSGFFDKDESAIDAIENSAQDRLKPYAAAIGQARRILARYVPEYWLIVNSRVSRPRGAEREFDGAGDRLSGRVAERFAEGAGKGGKKQGKGKKAPLEVLRDTVKATVKDDHKRQVMASLRGELGDATTPWFDAVFAASEEDASYAPLLGSGANDGNFEITDNFAQCITRLMPDPTPDTGGVAAPGPEDRATIERCLHASLFGQGGAPTEASHGCFDKMKSAFYFPGGYIDNKLSLTNPWDYVFAIEGTLLFAGGMSRRSSTSRAAFPFTVDLAPSGYGTAADEKSRGEVWIPLWDRPASYPEIRYLFNEGRSQVGSRGSATGTDFARAAASLGTERGVSAFQRFVIVKRKGDAHMSSNAGRVSTKEAGSNEVNLFADFDSWTKEIRSTKNLPKHIASMLRRIDGTITRFCTNQSVGRLQEVLAAVGATEMAVMRSLRDEGVRPLDFLSLEWATRCYDGTPEFRIAAALASIEDPQGECPIRHNIEPVRRGSAHRPAKWDPGSVRSVWRHGDLLGNMTAVLVRRCTDHAGAGVETAKNSKWEAPVADVLKFIESEREIDHAKIASLVPGLAMINYRHTKSPYVDERLLWDVPPYMPEPYVCIKSNFPPTWNEIGHKRASSSVESGQKAGAEEVETMLFEPRMPGLLRAGNVRGATLVGMRRLYVSGWNMGSYEAAKPMPAASRLMRLEDPIFGAYGGAPVAGTGGRRNLAARIMAAALIPIESNAMKKMVESASVPREDESPPEKDGPPARQ